MHEDDGNASGAPPPSLPPQPAATSATTRSAGRRGTAGLLERQAFLLLLGTVRPVVVPGPTVAWRECKAEWGKGWFPPWAPSLQRCARLERLLASRPAKPASGLAGLIGRISQITRPLPSVASRSGGTGRRGGGLRIRCPRGCVGSSPTFGTPFIPCKAATATGGRLCRPGGQRTSDPGRNPEGGGSWGNHEVPPRRAADSKSVAREGVWVRVPPSAHSP